MTATLDTSPRQTGRRTPVHPAAELLHDARAQERAARISDAIASYEAAIAAAEGAEEPGVLAEALRRLAVIRHHRNESDEARRLCHASYTVAHATGNDLLAAEALNTLGGIDLETDAVADARRHFLRALELGGHSRGLCARAEQNLGILANIQGDLDEALARYGRSLQAYRESNDEHGRAIAYHNLGMASADRERFDEAEASRELALLYQAMGRNQEALGLLNAAHRLFGRLDARTHLVHVAGKMADLEATYLAVVREWGQSLESADTYTFGHCERVARLSVAVARALGLDGHAQTTVRLGAYLHDLGKVRVPHEILSKPGPLTRDELEVVQMHSIWGIELLAKVEFPWDIKPVIRWHHERYDGTGYPDRLRGDEIPVSAQIVGIVDVYDALTTTRPYHPAMAPTQALTEMTKRRGAWSAPVLEAFLRALLEASRERRGRVHRG